MKATNLLSLILILIFFVSCSRVNVEEASQIMEKLQTIRIMTFNIAVGGRQIQDGATIIEAIDLAQADFVGIQEAHGNGPWFQEQLATSQKRDWYISSPDDYDSLILSRFPIQRNAPGGGVEIELANGQKLAIFNRHLRGYPYGPYDLRDGKSPEEVIENEAFHVNQIQETIDSIEFYREEGWLVFLTGDFNTPSHLDWTPENAASNYNLAIDWPLSKELEKHHLRDTFRVMWPDPISRPGYTWTEGWYPPKVSDPNEKFDRIDFIYFSGDDLQLVDSRVLGYDKKNPSTDIEVQPWGTDHRAVVSTFILNSRN